jgi:lipoprotein-anchoring transpeptidase ErfK/SrfK
VVETVGPQRPITGEQTVLPVLARSTRAGGIPWLRVMLPGRPNSSSGWIAQRGTTQAATDWRIRVDLGARRVRVYRRGRIVKDFPAVVGKPSTPTPTGSFFVEETVQLRSGEPGGPFALALSARSDVLQEFEGGPGQIAIHGRDSLGGVLGQAESHGCMRLGTSSIDWLAARIGPGVPVSILP